MSAVIHIEKQRSIFLFHQHVISRVDRCFLNWCARQNLTLHQQSPGLAGKSALSWAWARPQARDHVSVLRHPTAFQYIELSYNWESLGDGIWGRWRPVSTGLIKPCPFTIHTYITSTTVQLCWCTNMQTHTPQPILTLAFWWWWWMINESENDRVRHDKKTVKEISAERVKS